MQVLADRFGHGIPEVTGVTRRAAAGICKLISRGSTIERRQSEQFPPYGTQPQSLAPEGGYSICQEVWLVAAEELRV